MYLNNLVHFFDGVNILVSVTMQEATNQATNIVKNSTAIQLDPQLNVRSGRAGKISLDAWSRQVCTFLHQDGAERRTII